MVHLTYRWMGELRKPSSLDPVGWIALRPVSGAAATVFFLREVLGLLREFRSRVDRLESILGSAQGTMGSK